MSKNAGKYKSEIEQIDKVVKQLRQLKKSLKECRQSEWSYDYGDAIRRVNQLLFVLDELQ